MEKGGNGVPPAALGAATKSNLKNLVNRDVVNKLQLPPDDLKAESQAEAEQMIAVGKHMVEMALKSQHSGISKSDQNLLMATLNSILMKAKK